MNSIQVFVSESEAMLLSHFKGEVHPDNKFVLILTEKFE